MIIFHKPLGWLYGTFTRKRMLTSHAIRDTRDSATVTSGYCDCRQVLFILFIFLFCPNLPYMLCHIAGA